MITSAVLVQQQFLTPIWMMFITPFCLLIDNQSHWTFDFLEEGTVVLSCRLSRLSVPALASQQQQYECEEQKCYCCGGQLWAKLQAGLWLWDLLCPERNTLSLSALS